MPAAWITACVAAVTVLLTQAAALTPLLEPSAWRMLVHILQNAMSATVERFSEPAKDKLTRKMQLTDIWDNYRLGHC